MGNILHLSEVDSTNEYLNDLIQLEKCEDGTIVVASFQTNGKGQIGNSWESEAGKNLTFSLLLYPTELEISEQFSISKAVSLGIVDVLQKHTADISIKWPNDIYWNDKKIAGVLIENAITGKTITHCIVGIGLNVNQELFTSNAPNPISLKQITQKEYNLKELLQELRSAIFARYTQLLNHEESLYNDYFQQLYRNKGYYLYEAEGQSFEAQIKCVKLNGHLVLESKDGQEKSFAFKEVQFVI